MYRPAILSYINETDSSSILLPARARQATSDSRGPKIDVLDRRFRDRLPVRDIRELQVPRLVEARARFR